MLWSKLLKPLVQVRGHLFSSLVLGFKSCSLSDCRIYIDLPNSGRVYSAYHTYEICSSELRWNPVLKVMCYSTKYVWGKKAKRARQLLANKFPLPDKYCTSNSSAWYKQAIFHFYYWPSYQGSHFILVAYMTLTGSYARCGFLFSLQNLLCDLC